MTPTLPFADYDQPTRPFCGLVILGEAPGAAEIEQGRPFVGRSGQLLTRALEAAGIDRTACLVANVFRYRPPNNQARHFFQSEREGGNPARQYGRHSLGFCREEYAPEIEALTVALRQARAVLALGAVPLWATTGRQGVTENAGQIIPCRLAPVPTFPTYHPAFILRGNHHLAPAWRDHMRRAVDGLGQ